MKRLILVRSLGLVGAVACGANVPLENGVTEGGATGTSGLTCEPGATRECFGPGACHGAQACDRTGSYWGACDCGAGIGGAANTTGLGGGPPIGTGGSRAANTTGLGGGPPIGTGGIGGNVGSVNTGAVGDSGVSSGQLVFWNKLGSQAEVENSEVGPNGYIYGSGTSFVEGRYGGGFTSGLGKSGPNFGLWKNINSDFNLRGTLEFWWKPSRSYDERDSAPDQLFVSGLWTGNAVWPFQLMYRWREYDGYGGFEVAVSERNHDGGWYFLVTGKVAPFKAGDWVHVACVWDMNGLPAHSEVYYGVYVDGSYYPLFDKYSPVTSINHPMNKYDGAELSMGYYDADYSNQCQGTLDNVKIFDYAKTDFSDRFSE